MEHAILIKYAEIHLKGLNRPFFEKKLVTNIRHALGEIPGEIVREQGRVFVYAIPEASIEEAALRLTRVFGIHSLCITRCVEKDWETIVENAGALMAPYAGGATFKVFARRADKRFPMTSEEICRELGGRMLEMYPMLKVDVHTPQIPLTVEIRQDRCFVYTRDIPGCGGLPVGTSGRAMLLISGGIDSPVAGYMIAKRGVQLVAVHYHSFPYTSEFAKQKVLDLAKILSDYCCGIKVYVVPFTEIQMQIHEKCPEDYTTLIMRRYMMRIAERIARKEECLALITGESVGQVASQTMEALATTDQVVEMPVFRPLIGFDKIDIIEYARKIGTYETSSLPYEDCCTVFTPKHPATKPKMAKILEGEGNLDQEALIAAAVDNAEIVEL